MTTEHDDDPASHDGSRQRYAASTREHDLALLAAGEETGWWDDDGRPAPWPDDFFFADGTINPDWQPSGGPTTPTGPGEPPF